VFVLVTNTKNKKKVYLSYLHRYILHEFGFDNHNPGRNGKRIQQQHYKWVSGHSTALHTPR